MNTLTQEDIEEINNQCPTGQGIYLQPYGIPTDIKELVVYSCYETGGMSGGSYHEDSNPQPYHSEPPKDRMKVLDIVLKILKPNISYLDFKMISGLIDDNEYTENEYYGNCSDYKVEFIKLSDLYKALKKLEK